MELLPLCVVVLALVCSTYFIHKMCSKKIDYAGRVALVTGGASGIGFQLCRMLIKHRITVVIWDIDDNTLQRAVAEVYTGEIIVISD